MTMPDRDGTRNWIGRTVVDRDGTEIGVCSALLADTATGLPEWMYVERDEVTLVVPLLEAAESGGRVQVTVTRAHVDGAPRFDPARELSRAQEAALYRHYEIEYSTATSDSLLPAEAQQTDAGTSGSAPGAAVRQVVASGDAWRGRGVAAAVAVLAGVTAAVVAAVRLRWRTSLGLERLLRRGAPPPRPVARRVPALSTAARAGAVQVAAAAGPVVDASVRLARRGASASAASARSAAVDAAQRSRAASTAARTYTDVAAARLAPLLAMTGHVAWRAVRAGTDSALRVTDAATEVAVSAVPRLTAGTARARRTGLRALLTAGAAAEAVPERVARTGGRLEKRWRRVMGRLSLAFGLGVGYVLGARAGRARYGQITEAAAGVMERPEVQRALDRARTAVPAPLRSSIDRLSGRGSDSRGTSAEPIDAGAVVRDDLDVVTPPPPESGTGSPGTAASMPDPLIPPAKSGDDPIARQ